ncbi:MAG: hypothetical protein HYU66_22015 [Armatimonadetes bacterium]|nr:hypothetical protein [Armatimonadota bacterium]
MRFALVWIGWLVLPALAGTAPAEEPASLYRPFGLDGRHPDLGWTDDPLLDRLDSLRRRPGYFLRPGPLVDRLNRLFEDQTDWETFLKDRGLSWRHRLDDRLPGGSKQWLDELLERYRSRDVPREPMPWPDPNGHGGTLWLIAEAECQA